MQDIELLTNKQRKDKLLKFVVSLPFIGLFILAILLLAYKLMFNGWFSSDQSDWGAFGDFIGGVLNPILSVLTLFVLALAYVMQREELKETKEALKLQTKTTEEMAKVELINTGVKFLHERLFNDFTQRPVALEWLSMPKEYPFLKDDMALTLESVHHDYDFNTGKSSFGNFEERDKLALREFHNNLVALVRSKEEYRKVTSEYNPILDSIFSFWEEVIIMIHLKGFQFPDDVIDDSGLIPEGEACLP